MAIEWVKVTDQLPKHNDDCILYGKEGGIAGPMLWKLDESPGSKGGGMWIDLFATPEEGLAYSPDQVGWWAIFNAPGDA